MKMKMIKIQLGVIVKMYSVKYQHQSLNLKKVPGLFGEVRKIKQKIKENTKGEKRNKQKKENNYLGE